MKDIRKQKKVWEEKVLKKVLEKRPERKEPFENLSKIEIKRLYTPEDTDGLDYLKSSGFPGEFPFTRGVQPTAYRGRLWTMRQYAGMGDAEESNKRYKYLLKQGQTGLSVAFDLPTQIGYDSDHQLAIGEVGRVGVAIDSLQDMELLFKGVPLDKVSTSMTINSPCAILLAMYIAVAEKQGVKLSQLTGTTQNDILKEYIARGTYIFPPRPSLRLTADVIEYASSHLPRWNPISISGYHIREAGSTAVQELAFTLADGLTYVKSLLERNLKVDDFAPRFSFFFAVHNNFFEEVAKFRAARRLWARLMKERFEATNPKSLMLRFHTQTGGSTLTAQQPDNNIVRVTMQALAAVLGGTQSLHTNSRDEALSLPSEDSVRIALRTQQIIAYESGVTDTVDPLAGSYYLETLTGQMEEEALAYIKKIDDLGGMLKAIEKGFIQGEIQNSAYVLQKKIEDEEEIVVGLNKFQSEEATKHKKLVRNLKVEGKQTSRLKQLKNKRDNGKVKKTLDNIKTAIDKRENLMPVILEAVKAYVTVGEICALLRGEFGEYKESVSI
ncbi:MAG: methylmalonyl-CoA mutase family protein [bacterium]